MPHSEPSPTAGDAASPPPPRGWTRLPVLALATGLGLGYSPIAPGTVGSVWGLLLTLALRQWLAPAPEAAAIVALALVGVPLCGAAVRALGRGKDPGAIVFDEIVSLPMTFFLLPIDGPGVLVTGWLLNRVFDIVKPWPTRRLERLPGGWGVMADDWMAGLYSNLVLRLGMFAGLW